MRDFDFGQAFTAGFRLIGRRPVAIGAWGLVNLLISVVPAILVGLALGEGAMADSATGATHPLVTLVQLVTGLIAYVLVLNAVYRTVLEPEDSGGLYLRFGKLELLQLLVQICIALLFVVMVVAVWLGLVALDELGGWRVLIGFILGLAIWVVAVRFLPAGPMTFAERRFRLFESWSLTQGQWLKMFLLSFVLILTLLVLYLVFIAIFMGVMIGAVGGLSAMSDPNAIGRALGAAGPAVFVPVALVFLIVLIFANGAVFAILSAPWAEAYRQLAGRTVDAETFA